MAIWNAHVAKNPVAIAWKKTTTARKYAPIQVVYTKGPERNGPEVGFSTDSPAFLKQMASQQHVFIKML
jgi:hypothetical protein